MARMMKGARLRVRQFTTKEYRCFVCGVSGRMIWNNVIYRWDCLNCGFHHEITSLMSQG